MFIIRGPLVLEGRFFRYLLFFASFAATAAPTLLHNQSKGNVPPGPPKSAGFEYGQENTYFRIGLVLAYSESSILGFGIPKALFIIRETLNLY